MLWPSKKTLLSRRTLLIAGLVLLVLAGTAYLVFRQQISTAEAAWYNTGGTWAYRKALAVNHAMVNTATGTSTPLSSFPVLYSVTDPNLATVAHGGDVASSTGADILFADSDGATLLNYEIENYVSSTGELEAWIKIPSLSNAANKTVYMYFGNAAAPAETTSNSQNTWSNGYAGVWHMANQNGILSTNDSTSNGNSGTNNGATATTTGEIDGAASFNNQYVQVPDSSSLNPSSTMTFSFWMNPSAQSGYYEEILSKSVNNGVTGYGVYYDAYTNEIDAQIGGSYDLTFYTPTNGAWQYITATANGSVLSAYANGALQATTSISSIATSSDPLIFGINASYYSPNYYQGSLDEVRVSNVARTPDWIATEYNNQSSPSTFFATGPLQTQGSVSPSAIQVRGGGGGGVWTLIQHPSNYTCTGTSGGTQSCTVTASSTFAGDTLILLSSLWTASNSAIATSTFSSASGDSGWTHCPSSSAGGLYLGYYSTEWDQSDCAYILSAAGGATSLTYSWSIPVGVATWAMDAELLEVKLTGGTPAYDTGNATTTGALPGCTNCTGPTLTLSGSTDYIVQWGATEDNPSNLGSPYTSPADTEYANVAAGFFGALNQSSGAPVTWSFGTSTDYGSSLSAVAFKPASSGPVTYFGGVTDTAGDPVDGGHDTLSGFTINIGTSTTAYITAPGTGPQNVVSLGVYVSMSSGSANVRSAIYGPVDGVHDNDFLMQGASAINVAATSSYVWAEHTSFVDQAGNPIANPQIIGGAKYQLVASADGSGMGFQTGTGGTDNLYSSANYTSGYPSTISFPDDQGSELPAIRVGVRPAGGGAVQVRGGGAGTGVIFRGGSGSVQPQ